MVALDEPSKRVYIVCRKPGMVVQMDMDSGKVLSTAPAPLRADQVMYDADAHKLYVPGGEGYMGIYDTSDANSVKMVGKVTTAPGAKTGILLQEMQAKRGGVKGLCGYCWWKTNRRYRDLWSGGSSRSTMPWTWCRTGATGWRWRRRIRMT
jgi:hypothetical protein